MRTRWATHSLNNCSGSEPWRDTTRPQGSLPSTSQAPGEISVDLSDDELAKRKESWSGPRETIYASGALWKYAQLVGPTVTGAVTHPGAKDEKHIYADL